MVDLILDDSASTTTTPQPPAALRLNSGAFEVWTNIFLVSLAAWQGVVADVHSDGRHQRGRQDDRHLDAEVDVHSVATHPGSSRRLQGLDGENLNRLRRKRS